MQVMQVIAEILKREGISTLFCFPTTPIIEAAAAVGIRPVICRQERVGVHMADGFARVANGRPPGRLCDAIRAGRGERLCRRRHRLFGLDPGRVSAARPSARDGAIVPDVQIVAHLCLDHQIGRGGAIAARDRQHHAARLFPGQKRAPRAGHGRGAGRRHRHRGRCRPGPAPAGARDPLGRPTARRRRGRKDAARRLLPDDPRRAGRVLRRGDRRAAAAGRIAAGPGHDDVRRQERLSRGPRAGARAGRRHLHRTRPPYPAQIRPGAGRRLQLYPPRHRHPGVPDPARSTSTRPTTPATCTRLSPPISGCSATPSSSSAS